MAIDERQARRTSRHSVKKVQPLKHETDRGSDGSKGIHVFVRFAARTYAEQNELYAQGRTKPGPIVTKAKGGYSNHNFATAFYDIGIFSPDGKHYLDESPDYQRCGDDRVATGPGVGRELEVRGRTSFPIQRRPVHGAAQGGPGQAWRRPGHEQIDLGRR